MSSALDAVTKFRETPELVERLLPFLDSYSVWSLGQAHPPALQILKGSSLIWKDLVRRSCSDLEHLIKILKDMKIPKLFLLELLDTICERFPQTTPSKDFVQVSCPRHAPHQVSILGFMLLEEIEGGVGTAEQNIELVRVEILNREPFSFLSALNARLSRQQQQGARAVVEVEQFWCRSTDDAQGLLDLGQRCQRIDLGWIWVLGKLGTEGWTALAAALKLHPGYKQACFYGLDGAKKEDLRTAWDALTGVTENTPSGGSWEVFSDYQGIPNSSLICCEKDTRTAEALKSGWTNFETFFDEYNARHSPNVSYRYGYGVGPVEGSWAEIRARTRARRMEEAQGRE